MWLICLCLLSLVPIILCLELGSCDIFSSSTLMDLLRTGTALVLLMLPFSKRPCFKLNFLIFLVLKIFLCMWPRQHSPLPYIQEGIIQEVWCRCIKWGWAPHNLLIHALCPAMVFFNGLYLPEKMPPKEKVPWTGTRLMHLLMMEGHMFFFR